MPALSLTRTLIWRRLDLPSTEYFSLWRDGPGWQLRGTAIAALDSTPVQVRYAVLCDAAWTTTDVHIGMRRGGPEEILHLTSEAGRWRPRGGEEQEALQGCLDVDLGITPSTNTLPIRRLNLEIGQNADVTAAWIRFPDLTLEPLQQRYTKLDEQTYRYESGSGYTAVIHVDDLGLVTQYADAWERVADTSATALTTPSERNTPI